MRKTDIEELIEKTLPKPETIGCSENDRNFLKKSLLEHHSCSHIDDDSVVCIKLKCTLHSMIMSLEYSRCERYIR